LQDNFLREFWIALDSPFKFPATITAFRLGHWRLIAAQFTRHCIDFRRAVFHVRKFTVALPTADSH